MACPFTWTLLLRLLDFLLGFKSIIYILSERNTKLLITILTIPFIKDTTENTIFSMILHIS